MVDAGSRQPERVTGSRTPAGTARQWAPWLVLGAVWPAVSLVTGWSWPLLVSLILFVVLWRTAPYRRLIPYLTGTIPLALIALLIHGHHH